MNPLLFLLGLLVLVYVIYRSGRRGRKLNDAIERNRDIHNQIKIEEIEANTLDAASKLTSENTGDSE